MPKRKKILHIIQSLNNGGWENALLRILPLLSDFEHKIITLKELGELAPRFSANGIPVKTILYNGITDIAGIVRLQKIVRAEKPDVIITYLFHADAIGRIALQSITNAPIIPYLGTTYNYSRYFFIRVFERLSKYFVFHYLANSQAVKAAYVQRFNILPKKITAIPTGIDVDFFESVKPSPELLKNLNIHPNDFVIICVANLHPNKGHRYLLQAFEKLHTSSSIVSNNPEESYTQKKNIKLLIVGDGDERDNLKQQVADYQSRKNIFFLGRRNDVPELLKISHLFVLPTLFEGMSNAILEAMTCSLPIVTTDIPENRILIKDKKTGILIPTKSSDGIARAIQEILNNDHEARIIGIAAKEFVRMNFSLKKSSESLRNFLNSL